MVMDIRMDASLRYSNGYPYSYVALRCGDSESALLPVIDFDEGELFANKSDRVFKKLLTLIADSFMTY